MNRKLLCGSAAVAVALALVAGCSSASESTGPKKADSLITQGLSAANSGNTATAMADFQASIKADPVIAVPYYDIGVLYEEGHDNTDAATYFQKALIVQPTDISAAWDLALLDTSTSPTQAVTLYQQILTTDKNDPQVLFNLGLLLEKEGQATQGSADLQKAVRLDPALVKQLPSTPSSTPDGSATPSSSTSTTSTTQ